ncbi:MAG TPA: hypothetical protein VGF45_06955, partial [Polyangia bacterium]
VQRGCYTRTYMLRVLLGLLKGAVIGGAVGYVATVAGLGRGSSGYLVYAAVGFLVGIVCGKPLWRQETLWTPALKGVVGAAILAGLYWGAQKLLGGFSVPLPAALNQVTGGEGRPLVEVPLLLAPALAIIYGIFVEVDDGGSKAAAPAGKAPATKPGA